MTSNPAPLVGIVMGSASDWETMQHAATRLGDFQVPFEAKVISAHRSPSLAHEYGTSLRDRGVACLIAAAGGAAHLAGVMAALTTIPVLGVPMPSKHLGGLDSLLSTVQMPAGIPVATFAIGEAGAHNAALFAVALLARTDEKLAAKLVAFRAAQESKIRGTTLPKG
jgi:5-(carboxyamino)imidazole ribonucleotide mutase